jgi:predicted RNA-binding Zn ribbon-like protein
MSEELRSFSTVGNRLCLDFTNTIDDRFREQQEELFGTYRDLIAWSQQMGIATNEEARHLLEEAKRYPEKAESVRRQAITRREVIFRIFQAVVEESEPDEQDMQQFNTALSEAMCKARIVGVGEHYIWDWSEKSTALDWILWPVLRSTADILTSEEVHLVRQCASQSCSWLFLDTSKNHSRRWCDMQNCGNRAKVNRHYERKKQSASRA